MSDVHAERLTEYVSSVARERRWPNQKPKDAATLIVIDRRGSAPKVLMGKRHHGHKFMPGKFVFPGGRIEPHDRKMPALGALEPPVEAADARHQRGHSEGAAPMSHHRRCLFGRRQIGALEQRSRPEVGEDVGRDGRELRRVVERRGQSGTRPGTGSGRNA